MYIIVMMILQSLSSRHLYVKRLVCNSKQSMPYQVSLSHFFSTNISSSSNNNDSINHNNTYHQTKKRETKIQIIGNQTEYDAIKQLRLIQLPDEFNPDPNLLASMHVKRNIIFGTRVHDNEYLTQIGGSIGGRDEKRTEKGDKDVGAGLANEQSDSNVSLNTFDDTFDEKFGFVKVCRPLLIKALEQATKEGDQPQGLAALNGLCGRIQYLMENSSESETMMELKNKVYGESSSSSISNGNGEDKIVWEAIQSVATQIPRQGHDGVGMGTYLDSRKGWTELAKEYALERRGPMIVQGEAQLFQSNGAVFVGIEYIGEENPKYWKEAGGAMARFIFV